MECLVEDMLLFFRVELQWNLTLSGHTTLGLRPVEYDMSGSDEEELAKVESSKT